MSSIIPSALQVRRLRCAVFQVCERLSSQAGMAGLGSKETWSSNRNCRVYRRHLLCGFDAGRKNHPYLVLRAANQPPGTLCFRRISNCHRVRASDCSRFVYKALDFDVSLAAVGKNPTNLRPYKIVSGMPTMSLHQASSLILRRSSMT